MEEKVDTRWYVDYGGDVAEVNVCYTRANQYCVLKGGSLVVVDSKNVFKAKESAIRFAVKKLTEQQESLAKKVSATIVMLVEKTEIEATTPEQ